DPPDLNAICGDSPPPPRCKAAPGRGKGKRGNDRFPKNHGLRVLDEHRLGYRGTGPTANRMDSRTKQRRSMRRIVRVRGNKVNHVLLKQPATEPSTLRPEPAGNASRRHLNQAALLDPRTKDLRILLQAFVALGMRKDTVNPLPVQL